MNAPAMSEIERAPLDQIRQAEAEVTRRVAAARQAAEISAQKVQAEAERMKREACEMGERQGQAHSQEAISLAEEEGRALVAQARSRAAVLRREGDLCMDGFVSRAVEIVAGLEEEKTDA